MKWINRLYIFFLGIILAVTVGFGIAVFFPQPMRPVFPQSKGYLYTVPEICNKTPEQRENVDCKKAIAEKTKREEEDIQKQKEFEDKTQAFNDLNAGYTRTAVFFGIVMGAIFVIIGLSFTKTSKIVANGFLLSGILTAIFTRMLIGIASLGSQVTTTTKIDNISLIEFIVLLILSIGVFLKGIFGLKEEK